MRKRKFRIVALIAVIVLSSLALMVTNMNQMAIPHARFTSLDSLPSSSAVSAGSGMEIEKEKTFDPFQCTAKQERQQEDTFCSVYAGRHNLDAFWKLARVHLPDARTFVDVGANKGLVSARWLHLWRPELGITARYYAQDVLRPLLLSLNQPRAKRVAKYVCGVTNMCTLSDSELEAPPVPLIRDSTQESFQIHSFEPSKPLYDIHKVAFESGVVSREVQKVWNWHRMVMADTVGQVYFATRWDEGSQVMPKAKETPNTESATLDSIADTILAGRIIDVLKIDAENFDAQVIAGASQLLKDRRIRTMAWETPNRFPVVFPDEMGGAVQTFLDLVSLLERYGMTCYFPGKNYRMIKITGCWGGNISNITCDCDLPRCKAEISNAVCVQQQLAPSLAEAVETKSLTHDYR